MIRQAASGVYLIIWGLFKKVVVADNCAFFVNQIFENPEGFGSLELVLGAVLFAFQIYGDFSGYSDIAIGTARLFGLDLMTNFKFPYFSKDIADFWRRWHISLSTWFRDYVYIPLGGSRGGKLQQLRNVFVIFLVSGFWHGANWTFIVWGLIHSLLFLPLLLTKKNRVNVNNNGISFWPLLKIVFTFCMVTIAWVFFRADSVGIAVNYIGNMFSFQGSGQLLFLKTSKYLLLSLICFSSILLMLFYEFRNYRKQRDEVKLSFSTSLLYVVLIVFLGAFKNPVDFIYFQF
jgi:alginate O-acetyltransferase complex protein AlgI